jgi:hypothetical protein
MIINTVPLPAKLFGFAGLIPFIVATLLIWILPDTERFLVFDILIHYAAVILSFIGAIHWGVVMVTFSAEQSNLREAWYRLGWSVTPALVAWLATQMVLSAALVTLIAGFFATFFYDLWSLKKNWIPIWYILLRKYLTLVVLIALSSALIQSGIT